jgi:hypothetical protein
MGESERKLNGARSEKILKPVCIYRALPRSYLGKSELFLL